jgi:protein O-GlcNAc transferase
VQREGSDAWNRCVVGQVVTAHPHRYQPLLDEREIAITLQNALALHQQGQLAQAEPLYRTILREVPNHFDALHLLGVIEYQRKHCVAAVQLISQALEFNPKSASAHSNLGVALRDLKRHEEALASFDRALAIDPGYAEALNNRGIALHDLERHEEALASYDRALAANPDYAEAASNRGDALCQLKRHEEALADYDHALAIKPDYAEASSHRGDALRELRRHEAALASYDRALAIKSDFVQALNNRGVALSNLERHEEALASFERALAFDPDHAEALNNRGVVLRDLRRYEEALVSCDQALEVRPDYVEALNNRGIVLRDLKRCEEALASCDRALAIRPSYAEALNTRGTALRDLKRHKEALANYACALAIKPDYAEALNNRGMALFDLRRHDEAATEFGRLLSVKPEYDYARGNRFFAQLHCCDWKDYDRNRELISNEVAAGKLAAYPFVFLSVSESPEGQRQCAQAYNKDRYPASAHALRNGERYRHDKIRVAYLSADFHSHATAFLLAELFEVHDKSRFETTAVSFGPDGEDELRTRLRSSFDRFIDVRTKSDRDLALFLKELEIDIAVDLKGYTQDSRTGIFAYRPAPIQVNFLGYPGTSGADYIDYIIADRFVIPEDQHSFYTEKIAYLPDSYQPNDSKRRISAHTPTRIEVGLPETGFVFCSFNSNYKIVPPVFDVWMRLLSQVAGSVLWLLEANAASVRNLRLEAQRRGVAPDRLVFAPRIKSDDHLARHRLADLFLDTLPINAHTTASDALWAGLPVVTCLGSSFAGRVAGSLLHAVGLSELITDNLPDYEALALKLARDNNMLVATRAKLARNRQTFPLFDTDRFRRNIESVYQTMWERHQQKNPLV